MARAAELSAAQMKYFGLIWNNAPGKRRHGQAKHIRDLKRRNAKLEARR